jgi:phosphatidylglycerophosphatase C
MTELTKQPVGFFDFDCTLVLENSLRLFFREIAGRAGVSRHCLSLAALRAMAGRQGMRAGIKRHLYRELLAGRHEAEVTDAAERLASKLTPNRAVIEALEKLAASGGHIVVATASPRVVVKRCLEVLGVTHHLVLGTELETIDGLLTGGMLGGECLGPVKAVRVQGHLDTRGIYGVTTGFGNLPDDLAMLTLLEQRFVVGRGGIVTSVSK